MTLVKKGMLDTISEIVGDEEGWLNIVDRAWRVFTRYNSCYRRTEHCLLEWGAKSI